MAELVSHALLAARALLVTAAATSYWVPAVPQPARTAAAGLATLVVATYAGRRFGQAGGGLRTLLATSVGLLVALIGVGMVLDRVPGGLQPRSWATGLGVAGVLLLAAAARRPAPPRPAWSPVLRHARWHGAWYAASAAVVVAGVVLATNATRSSEVAPVAMYTRTDERGLTSVVVQSPVESGPYELWARWRDRHRQERQRRLTTAFTVPPGQPVVRPLPEWNTVHRVRTELRAPGTERPVRTVILAPRERSDAPALDRGPR